VYGMAKRGGAGAVAQGESKGVLNVRNVLVPVDFSENAQAAVQYAGDLARNFGAKLHLLHVVEPASFLNDLRNVPIAIDDDEVATRAESELRVVLAKALQERLEAKALVKRGKAYQEIAKVAKQIKADLIVISTHGYTGLKHTIMGSTAERVVRHAPCPVLVLRAVKD